MRWVVNSTPRPFTARGDPVPIVHKAGWALMPVWTGAENHPPPGFNPLTVQAVASRRYIDYDIPAAGHDSIPSKLLPTQFFAWVKNNITHRTFA